MGSKTDQGCYCHTLHDMGLLSHFFSLSNKLSLQVNLLKRFPLRSEGGLCCMWPVPGEQGSRLCDVNSQSLNHNNTAGQRGSEAESCKATICTPFSLNEAAASWITAREPV